MPFQPCGPGGGGVLLPQARLGNMVTTCHLNEHRHPAEGPCTGAHSPTVSLAAASTLTWCMQSVPMECQEESAIALLPLPKLVLDSELDGDLHACPRTTSSPFYPPMLRPAFSLSRLQLAFFLTVSSLYIFPGCIQK